MVWSERSKGDITDIRSAVKRTMIDLERDFGKILPVDQIVRYNIQFEESEVRSVIKRFISEGLVNEIDSDTIEVNYAI